MKDFYRVLSRPNEYLLPDELVGHTVVMLGELDMVIDMDCRFLPDCEFIRFGWQWLEGRPIQFFEKLTPRCPEVLHRPVKEDLQLFMNALVEVRQTEEFPVSQPGEDPSLHNLDPNFRLGLVPRFPHPGGNHHCAIMLRHILVCWIAEGPGQGGQVRSERDVSHVPLDYLASRFPARQQSIRKRQRVRRSSSGDPRPMGFGV